LKEEMKEINIPVDCPTCSSKLELVNEQLFCLNDSCPARSSKKLEHFAKTLKIRGLGPATLNKLQVQDLHELYSFSEDELCDLLGSDKMGIKLHQEIEKSKAVDLITLIPAFSIHLIGNTAAQKLGNVISHIEEINEDSCVKAGLGPKATESLLNWLDEVFYLNEYDTLPFSFSCKTTQPKESNKGVVCITGKLKSYPTKAAAKAVLEKLGYIVKDSLTKDVTILLNESGLESSKTQTARERGVQIINNIKNIGE
jgi:NAD-dependent DNA ligase